MSRWSSMNQFGKRKHYPRPKTEQHWRSLYRAHEYRLPNVTSLKLVHYKKGAGQTGMRHFKSYKLAPLTHWNAHINVELEKVETGHGEAEAAVSLNSGEVVKIPATELTDSGLLAAIIAADPEGELVTDGPGYLQHF
eukprot:TRINITY_DN25_c0_g1_i2.p1 TRINITY_DN25_c0_g1~~TRINITY_DN25_c0_g1_i2.p1  ORF type:complete len:137 (+),score=16.88 TRINITY_DN25_c0_g1_i2:64-474(+)